jgi:peptidoglycan/xylan/chitin deacetylase (PgdA/CDA1 family)
MTHQQKINLFGWLHPLVHSAGIVKKMSPPVLMPFYHTVSDEVLPHIAELYSVKSSKRFRNDLDYLLRFFTPLSMQDFISGAYDKSKAHMLLSFDDGLKECHSVIAPILKEKGIPAAFFINPAFIDDKAWFYRYEASWLIYDLKHQEPADDASCTMIKMKEKEKLRYQEQLRQVNYNSTDVLDKIMERMQISRQAMKLQTRVYLNSEELQSLEADGFHIGAHSQHHPEFSSISEDDQIREVNESMQALERLVNLSIRSFAFPFSDDGISSNQLKKIRESANLNISFGTSGTGKHPELNHYQRMPMEHTRNIPAKKIITGELMAANIKSRIKSS